MPQNDMIRSSPTGNPYLSDLQWSVDQLLLADGMLCAMGWCASTTDFSLDVALVFSFAGSKEVRYPLSCNLDRPDVSASRPWLQSRSGFFLYVPFPEARTPERIVLEIASTRGGSVSFPLTCKGLGAPRQRWKWRLLAHYGRRTLAHLRLGNWRLVMQRVRGHLSALVTRPVSVDDLDKRLEALPSDTLLIIDHALGGGANHYRDEAISQHLQRDRFVLLWTFSPLALSHQLSFMAPDRKITSYKVDFSTWEILIHCRKVGEILFNNCVSFPRPETIPDVLARFVRAFPGERRLTLLIHDFFSLCPSHFLLNHEGRYCDLPARSVCHQCLPAMNDPLAALFSARNIDVWRAHWTVAFEQATEVVCFSENTRSLLLKAYPELRGSRLRVIPHKVDYLRGSFTYDRTLSRLRVAVVGQVGMHKGSERYIALVEAARRCQYPIDFYVIGTLVAPSRPSAVVETGSYERNGLADLLTTHKIHIVLMLSIWPETFSYVTHELIKLGVPLLSYDIGAQGDAIGQYALGRTIPLASDGRVLLDHIHRFRSDLEQLYPRLDSNISTGQQ